MNPWNPSGAFYVLYNVAGAILGVNQYGWVAIDGTSVLKTDATEFPAIVDVAQNPTHYLVASGALGVAPNLSTTQATTAGVTTLTIALNNPPATPPTSATATIGTTAITVDMTDNVGSLIVQPHPTMASFALPVSLSADGVVGTMATVRSGGKPPVALQAITPTTSGDPYVIAPVGAGGIAYVLGFAAGSLSLQQQINALSVATAVLFHLAFNDLVPQATADAWAKLTLSTNAENALAQIGALLPNIIPILDAVNPSGGSPMPIWTEMLAALSAAQPAFANTNTYLSEIPGLE